MVRLTDLGVRAFSYVSISNFSVTYVKVRVKNIIKDMIFNFSFRDKDQDKDKDYVYGYLPKIATHSSSPSF